VTFLKICYHLITQIDFANKTLGRKRFYENGDLNINQIGSYNAVSLNIKAESINLDVFYKTEIKIHLTNKPPIKVVQDGQNNTIKDVSRYHANGTDVKFIQRE
jgi:hypothetical protein